MRVAFLLPNLSPSGGVQVVLQHAEVLQRNVGVEAAVVVEDSTGGELAVAPFSGEALTMPQARSQSWDVVVGTWWTTALATHELRAATRLILVQGDDERSYRRDEPFDRLGAAAAVALADGVLVVSPHLDQAVRARRPETWCRLVPVGIDKRPYASASRAGRDPGGPLRVLVEGQPSLPSKRVGQAVRAARGADTDVRVTLVALEPSSAGDLGADVVTTHRDAAGMAELYAANDVLVKLSLFEGLGLPPLEAAHVGTPSIVTPYGGHTSWLEHGQNGLLVGFDDDRAVSGWLTRLARDPALLGRLGEGARRTAGGWPDVREAGKTWEQTLFAAAGERERRPAPAGDMTPLLRRQIALGRSEHARLRTALAAHMELVEELFESRDDVAHRLEMLESSRAYRTVVSVRDGLQRVLGRRGGRGAS